MSAKTGKTDQRYPGRSGWTRRLAFAGLFLLAIFVLFPLFQTGFTTRDDAETGLLPDQWGGWWPAVWALTMASGRFFHLVSLSLVFAMSRLCSSSPIAYHLISGGAILLNVAVFYFVTARALASKAAGVLAAACALTWLQNGWYHNLITSYPVLPHLGLSFFLGVVLLLLAWKPGGRRNLVILAGVTYLAALLVSEAFVVYFPVLLGFCALKAWQSSARSPRERFRIIISGAWPITTALVLYLLCYCVFRHAHPSRHYGNQLAAFDLGRIAAVLKQFSTSTFPGYFYFRDSASINATFDGFAPNTGRIWQLFEWVRPEWIAKALVAALFCWLILSRGRRLFSGRSFLLSLIAGVALLIAPILLVSLTRQYQDWVLNSNTLSYGAPSYYAHFSMVFVIVVVMLGLGQFLTRWRFAWRCYVLLAFCFVAGTSLATDYYNHYITVGQQLSHLKWKTMDRFARTEEFAALPAGVVIYAPSLWNVRGIVESSDNYWTEYLSQRFGKKVAVVRSAPKFKEALVKSPNSPTCFLAFEQEPKEPNQFVVFAQLKHAAADIADDGAVYADVFTLFTYSKNRKFTLIGYGAGGASLTLEVDGQRIDNIEGNVFLVSVDHERTPGDFPRTTVRSTGPVDLSRLAISYFPIQPRPKAVEIRYGSGFYGEERDPASGITWSWSKEEAELLLINNSPTDVARSIRFQLMALTGRSVTVRVAGTESSFVIEGGGFQVVELPRVLLRSGENKIFFRSDQPAQAAGSGDARPIAFGVRSLTVAEPSK